MADYRRVELIRCDGEGDVTLGRLGPRPTLIGRANVDIELDDPAVSRHHLLAWCSKGRVFVQDVGSSLGTRVGGRMLAPGKAVAVGAEDEIELAASVRLRWRSPRLAVAGVASTPGGSVPGRSFHEIGDTGRATDTESTVFGDMTVTVTCVDGAPRRASIQDAHGRRVEFEGESRVVLLYLLANRHRDYLLGRADDPWVGDKDLAIGLWGARGRTLPTSRINTVIARVRQQLRDGGIPVELLRKEPGVTGFTPALRSVRVS